MKLENQVATLEQSKRLKELGIIQSGIASWWQNTAHNTHSEPFLAFGEPPASEIHLIELATAYTVAELGVMLPSYIADDELYTPIFSKGVKYEWNANYYGITKYLLGKGTNTWSRVEAHSRAALLIHLLESGRVTAAEVNARLAA